ncbi:hypothetical protein [Cohnella lupini]|uniref:Uncharacterized protein n=1 Tax=Cohnella lupini TaxID=1294267 RepID=A0A3D9IPT7_9BACL|nr:hypothetical protein [Cohnella lupini]RED63794.1 hypothetical protein DFP95_10333 [Cohnella lupini]
MTDIRHEECAKSNRQLKGYPKSFAYKPGIGAAQREVPAIAQLAEFVIHFILNLMKVHKLSETQH